MLWGAVGVADLVAAPGGDVVGPRRALAGIVAAAVTFGLLIAVTDTRAGVVAQVGATAVAAAAAAGWLLGRARALTQPRWSASMLVGALAVTVVALAAADWLGTGGGGAFERWLAGLPYASTRTSPARAAMALAVAPALVGTANAVVRLALASVSVQIGGAATPDRTLRGGRLIGPIERLLIFGFALAGEPTAASLIIAAKGLLRFPELSSTSRSGQSRVDEVSEYLLVGSLVSWTLALVPVLALPSG